jgi:hypothetical protein
MPSTLKTLWNLPTTLLGLVSARFQGLQPKIHRGCGGLWDNEARWGPMYERCMKCGAERRRK